MASSLVVAVVGPTATGKSALAIELARRCGGEVINADAMQLYRGMDIGTAKLTGVEREGVPHHVFDIWEVAEAASVAEYQRIARGVVTELHTASRVPIVAGGSGLYVHAVLEQMEVPGTDQAVRDKWNAELERLGSDRLHRRLAEVDPAAASAILPSNSRRIVRALEVIDLTGRPFPARSTNLKPFFRSVYIGLDAPTEQLDAAIDRRVLRMWELGLVDEVRALLSDGLADSPTASRALGYAQVLRMLKGEITEAEAIAHTQQATRRFVRRQRSWFRRDKRVRWFSTEDPQLVARAVESVTAAAGLSTD